MGQATIQVGAGQIAQVGTAGQTLVLASTPQPPGAMLLMRAVTPAGGAVQFTVPVLAPVDQYASLTPTAAPTP